MTTDTSFASELAAPLDLLETHVESFLGQFLASGYAARTLRNKRRIATSFVRWTRRKQLAVQDLNESHVAAFVKRSPRRRKARVALELSVLRRYVDYLGTERGLAQNSLNVYSPFVHDFLTEQAQGDSAGFAGLDARVIRDFLLKESKKGTPRATIRIIRDVMNGPFKMAVEDEILPASPMAGITKALRLEAMQYKVRALDALEQILLLDTARTTNPRIHPLILFMLRTGVRLGEAIGIQWQDLDLEKGIVWIRRSFRRGTFEPPKNGKPRAVRHTKETIATLAALSAQNGAEQDHFVFPTNKAGKDPMPQNSARNRFKEVLAQAGLDSGIRIHALRHTYVTNRLSLGHPIDPVSREAGHSSIEITANIYSHWIPEKTDEAIHDLDRIGKPEAPKTNVVARHPPKTEEPVTN